MRKFRWTRNVSLPGAGKFRACVVDSVSRRRSRIRSCLSTSRAMLVQCRSTLRIPGNILIRERLMQNLLRVCNLLASHLLGSWQSTPTMYAIGQLHQLLTARRSPPLRKHVIVMALRILVAPKPARPLPSEPYGKGER